MIIIRFILIFAGLLMIACGSDGGSADNDSNGRDESARVEGMHLRYAIQIDNIPLIGPQSEQIDLFLASGAVHYAGKAEVTVVDEIKQIRRAAILKYSEDRQIILNPEDSTYRIEFYDIKDQNEELEETADELPVPASKVNVTKTDQLEDIADFGSCRKWTIRTSRSNKKDKDSIPILKGSIWIKEDLNGTEYLAEYYNSLRKYYRDTDFDGLELWRVLRKLDIPAAQLVEILENIDGLIVKADLVCERFSLGRKAKITVSANLSDMLEQRLIRELFEIPAGYEPAPGKESLP